MLDLTASSPKSQDWGLNRAVGWRMRFCWFPHYCFLSGKPLWGKRAYHGVNIITGPGDPVQEEYWIEKNEFLIWNLKGRK